MGRGRALVVVACLAAAGCGKGETAGSPLLAAPPRGAGLQLAFSGAAPSGEDVRVCRLLVVPADLQLGRVESRATLGLHHVEIALTDVAAAEVDGQPFDCASREVPRRGVFYAAQETAQELTFGGGATLPLLAGDVLLVEVHLVNATMQALTTDVALDLWAAAAPGPTLGTFRLAPATATSRVICRFARDRELQVLGGDRGMNDVTLSLAGGALTDAIPLFEGGPADPLVFRPGLRVAAGERFELACADGDADCILLGTYFPADEGAVADCQPAP